VDTSTKRITDTITTTQTIVGAGLIFNTLFNPRSSGAIRISMLAQMIQYIKYLDIDYPENVRYAISNWNDYFINFNSDDLDLTPNIFEHYGTAYHSLPSPITAYDDNIDPSFLMNFWDDLLPLFIVSGLLVLVVAFEVIVSNRPLGETSKKIIHQLRICTQGLFITYLYDHFDNVFFFAILSYRTTKKATALTVINILVSIFFIIGTIATLIAQTWIVKKYQTLKNKRHEEFEKFETKIEGVKILWKDFKVESFFQMNTLFFTVLHNILFCIILGALTEHPLAQVVLFNIMSLAVIAYLIWFKPFDENHDFLQTFGCEVILFGVNICLLILMALDSNSSSRESVGEAILILALVFNLIPHVCLLMIATKCSIQIYHAVKAYRLKRKLEKLKKTQIAPIIIEPAKNHVSPTSRDIPSPGLLSTNSFGEAKKESVGMNLLEVDSRKIPGSLMATPREGASDHDDQLLKVGDLEDSPPVSSLVIANRQQNLLKSNREYLKIRKSKDGLEEIFPKG